MDSTTERWKSAIPDKKLDIKHYDNKTLEWIQKDMMMKFLTIFSSPRLLMIDRQQSQMKEAVKRQKRVIPHQIWSQIPLAHS